MSLITVEELRSLAEQSQYPSISIYMPTERAGSETQQNPIRFKNLIRQVEGQLQGDAQIRGSDASALLQPVIDLDRDNFWQHQDEGLAIFVNSDVLRYYRIPLIVEELTVVGDRFHLKPLLPLLTNDGSFYLLALSQKNIRLFQGSHYSIREIELGNVSTNLGEALNYDETAQSGQFRISTSKGGTNNTFQQTGTFHGQGSPDRDDITARILQFFHILDRELQPYFQGENVPLILAGVEYLLPIYQEANTYPLLIDTIVPVENIDVFDPNDVHAQVWSMVEPFYTQSKDAAIEHYYELSGTGKTSTDLKEAVAAAYYGRVDQLFVAVGTQRWGNFDPQANELNLHSEVEPGDEDLLSAAAVETILNGGVVYAVKPEDVPEQACLAAVFRY